MALTVVSLLEEVIYVDLEDIEDYNIFAGIFVCDEMNIINRIQIADNEYKLRTERMVNITTTGRFLYDIKSKLCEIPTNSKFIVLRDHYDNEIFLTSLKCEVYKLNQLNRITSKLSQNNDLHSLYETFVFYGGGEKEFIGEKNIEKRVCRFCGKMRPEASFSNKSHAISEFLGNKSLICLEECNSCNSKFGNTIEPEFSRMLSPFLSLFMIKGKKGYRKAKGKNFIIEPNKRENNDGFYLKFILQNNSYTPEAEDGFHVFDTSANKYVPQDVYKCLCKYVISLIGTQYLPYFKETINWINSSRKYCKLPMLAIDHKNDIYNKPSMTVNIRKNNNYDIPYCIATLTVCDIAVVFIVPFCSKDKYSFTTSKKYMKFKEIVKSSYFLAEWNFIDYSYTKKRYCAMGFKMKFFEH